MNAWTRTVVLGLPLTACTESPGLMPEVPAAQSVTEDPAAPPTVDAPAAPAPPTPGPELAMKSVAFDEASMHLDILEVEHDTKAWDIGGVLMQTVRLGEYANLGIVVRVGEGVSPDELVRDHSRGTSSAVKGTTVCGRAATTVEIQEPEEHIACIQFSDGRPNRPGYFPAMTTVGLAFSQGVMGGVATWSVPTAHREQYRPLEERFFASLGCE